MITALRPSRRLGLLGALAAVCMTAWLDPTNAQPKSAASASAPASQAAWPLVELAQGYRQKARQAAALTEAAAAAKAKGQADQAAGLEAQAATARQLADSALAAIRQQMGRLLKDVDNDSYVVRQKASVLLEDVIQRVPWLISQMRQAAVGASVEVLARVDEIAAKIGDIDWDVQGRLHQWASDARASSQYGDPDWSAKQATGKPNTPAAGDFQTAWASQEPDAGEEWLELTYKIPVRPAIVRVCETFNPGAVVKLDAKDPNGAWCELWKGKDTTTDCPGWLDIPISKPAWPCRVIRITLDCTLVKGWNEIDAVELIGEQDDDPPAARTTAPADPR